MLDLLRSTWDEDRPPGPPSPGWRDWSLVGLLALAAVLEGALRPDVPFRILSVIIAVALVPSLLWRRSRPLLMVAIVFGVCGLAALLTGGQLPDLYVMVFPVLLAYALSRWGSGREAVAGAVIMVAKVGLSAAFGVGSFADFVAGVVALFAAMALGAAVRYRIAARMREFEQVKLLERERLARDLHDTVAHHVSAMAIRAQAGIAASASHPEAAVEALHVIEAEASRALAEMGSMVSVLRRGHPADRAPSPSVADLERLVGQTRTGPPVDLEIVGDLDGLAAPVGTAIYRLAQESITNARRHARQATRIVVRVAADETSVRLNVSDDGEANRLRPAGSSGYGIVGMAERAGLLGGVCEAGPNPGRGWTVSAILPRTGSAT